MKDIFILSTMLDIMKILRNFSLAVSLVCLYSCDSGGDSTTAFIDNTSVPINALDINGANSSSGGGANGADSSLESTYEQEIFDKINDLRSAEGLDDLILDSQITTEGDAHNIHMAEQREVSHDNFEERAETLFAAGYVFVGENTGTETGFSASAVTDFFVNAWFESDGHRANILGDYTHTGISVHVDVATSAVYATQIFAR